MEEGLGLEAGEMLEEDLDYLDSLLRLPRGWGERVRGASVIVVRCHYAAISWSQILTSSRPLSHSPTRP